MKVVSFNANGIRSAQRKGFFEWLAREEPDFVCIQETKAQIEQLSAPVFSPKNYHCEYFDALKKGYSGVAIYAKEKPTSVIKGLNYDACDREGRYLQFDYPNLTVISLYLPSGTTGDVRQQVKYDFLDFFSEHLQKLKQNNAELIICGDYNIAHQKRDLKNWRSNQKNSGFLPEERAWLDKVFGPLGFIDAFRVLNNEEEQYTWWSNRGQAYAKNVGWRLDYQVITEGLKDKIKKVDIYKEERFSDHAPLVIEYEGV